MILAIGGESQGQSLSNVECFMMGYDGWKCSIPRPSSAAIPSEADMVIIPTMKQCRYYSAVAYGNYSIYIIGMRSLSLLIFRFSIHVQYVQ